MLWRVEPFSVFTLFPAPEWAPVGPDDRQLFRSFSSLALRYGQWADIFGEEHVIVDGGTRPGIINALLMINRLPGLPRQMMFDYRLEKHAPIVQDPPPATLPRGPYVWRRQLPDRRPGARTVGPGGIPNACDGSFCARQDHCRCCRQQAGGVDASPPGHPGRITNRRASISILLATQAGCCRACLTSSARRHSLAPRARCFES